MPEGFEYPRETVDHVYFDRFVVLGSTPPLGDCEFSLAAGLARPTNWQPVELLNGQYCFPISNMLPGDYRVFVRINTAPDASVTEVGKIRIT